MNTPMIRFIIDLIAYLLFLSLISTGFLLYFTFPSGSQGGQGLTLWTLNRYDVEELHFYSAIGFIATILVHVVLQWSWIVKMFKRCAPRSAGIAGSVLVLITVGALVLPFAAPLERDDSILVEFGSSLAGSMTWRDIEAASGIPFESILKRLDIQVNPESVRFVQVGSFLREHGMNMSQLRIVVEELQRR